MLRHQETLDDFSFSLNNLSFHKKLRLNIIHFNDKLISENKRHFALCIRNYRKEENLTLERRKSMVHLSYEQECRLIERYLSAFDVPQEDAAMIGKVIAHSDFTGVYSHGLSRFVIYLQQYREGAINAHPEIRKVSDNGAAVAFDCDNASGIVSVNRVYDEVLERARKYGVAAGVGRRGANINCGGYYGFRMAEDNVIGIVMSNTYPCMAPFGGAERLIGTNPIIMGCPSADGKPIVLDISTSFVAIGKVFAYRRENKTMPLGWANDINGVPTTDPHAAYCVTPAGEHKGYGLAIFVELFSAILSGACVSAETPFVEEMKPENTGFSVILLDISHFIDVDEFKRRATEFSGEITNSRKAEGVEEIFMPGEIEYRNMEKYKRSGLDFSDALCAELETLGHEIGALPSDQSFADFCAALNVE